MLNLTNNINPTQAHISDYVEVEGGFIAHRFGILTTNLVAYEVYEPSKLFGPHSTITHHDQYGWLGSITTRALPPVLDAMPPMTAFRSQAVTVWHAGLEAEAEAIIRATFPQDFQQEDVRCPSCQTDTLIKRCSGCVGKVCIYCGYLESGKWFCWCCWHNGYSDLQPPDDGA